MQNADGSDAQKYDGRRFDVQNAIGPLCDESTRRAAIMSNPLMLASYAAMLRFVGRWRF